MAYENGLRNVLGGFQYVQDQQERGEEKRRVSGLRGLMGDYYGAQDPQLGQYARLGGDAAGMQKDMQGQEDRKREQLGQFAALLVKAPPQMRAGLYRQIQPQLAQIIPDAPVDYTPEIDGLAEQIAAQFGGKAAAPETFSNAGAGFILGNRGTVRELDGYAERAGALAGSQAEARARAQAQYRAPPRPVAPRRDTGPMATMAERRATLESQILPGLESDLGTAFTPQLRQQVIGEYLGTGKFNLRDPRAPATARGPNGAPVVKSSGDERAAAGYLGRMNASEKEIQQLYADGYNPGNLRDFLTAGEGVGLNWAASDKGQLHRQQQEDFVRAKLRKESGAAIPVEEMDREIKTYFPQPGDSKLVIDGKTRSRAQAIKQMETMAGRAFVAPAPKADSGALSPEEQAELEALRKRFGKR